MTEPTYDSRPDTHQHITEVRGLLLIVANELIRRAHVHDQSKLESSELEAFDQVTPRLKELTYGSDEYKAGLADLGEALKHHYAANDHHPEHHRLGVKGMNLIQLIELLCDWQAACKRHPDGSIHKSIDVNMERFGYNTEWAWLFLNTADEIERLGKRPRDADLLAEFRAAESNFNMEKVQCANDGGVPDQIYLDAERRYWAAHSALLGRA